MKVLDSPCLRHNCSKCCRQTNMPITIRESEIISQITHKDVGDFTKNLSQTTGILELTNDEKNKSCVFLQTNSKELDAEGTCTIHANRPQGCRLYPFILDMDDNVWKDDYCPYVKEFPMPSENNRQALLALDSNVQAEARMRKGT